MIKRYEIEITGVTPLMTHRMDVFALLEPKSGKKKIREEQTPRQIAERALYRSDDGTIQIPTEFFVGALRHVAGDYKQQNSARRSLKGVVSGSFEPEAEFAALLDKDGKTTKEFEVDVRRAVNHKAGAIAVCRPRWDRWSCKLVAAVDTSVLVPEVVKDMLEDAGRRSGVGSFRVANSGRFGKFQVTKWKELKA